MIKVGLIGCGAISKGHISAFEEVDNAQIVAACDINENNLRCAVEKTDAQGFYDYKKMMRRKWQPTPVILPGKSHGQRRLAGDSRWGLKRVE